MSTKPATGHASEMTLLDIAAKLPVLSNGRVPVETPPGGAGLTDTELRAAPVEVAVLSMPQGQGGLTDTELRALPIEVTGFVDVGTVPVTGTFWQATQPVSGTVSISGTIPVSGTFWQATQPVSGTFWQATQPVSGPLTDTQLRASAVPVSLSAGAAMTFVSLKSAAPAANAVQADTGALTAGDYDFDISLACSDTVAVGKGLVIEHRNAANNANINVLGGCSPNGGAVLIQIRKVTLAANERVRVIAGTAAGAASSMYISAIGRRPA